MNDMVAALLSPALDTDAATPLNEQLAEAVRQAVLKGQLDGGTRLPASRALAERLSLSRNTVLAAYDQLVAEGYLETRQGAGTFVAADLPDHYLALTPAADQPADAVAPRRSFVPNRPLAGMPALDAFPTALWARLAGSAWRHAGPEHLQHMDPMGYRPLRTAIAGYLKAARGVVAHADQIVIVSGLQPGLRLIAESLVPAERALILEDPGYPGLSAAAGTLRHPLHYTAIDPEGATVPAEGGPAPGLMVVCPSRQYPLGHTMTLRRRLELLDWASRADALIFEDDYDSEFRYAGRPVSSLQGLDGGERVIYGGSFSKALYVALRLGYLVLPERLVDAVVRHRAATDGAAAIGPQLQLARFIEEGHFSRHLRHLRTLHRDRLALFTKAMARHLGRYFDFSDADAGLQVTAYNKPLLAAVPDASLAPLAHAAGIGAVPLSACYRQAAPKQGLLIGFANLAEAEIDNRLKSLADRIRQETGF